MSRDKDFNSVSKKVNLFERIAIDRLKGDLTAKYYFDGNLSGNRHYKVNRDKRIFHAFTDPVDIAVSDFGGKRKGFYEGLIDELRFYDRPLSRSEIKQNFLSNEPFNVEPKGKLPTVWATLKTR